MKILRSVMVWVLLILILQLTLIGGGGACAKAQALTSEAQRFVLPGAFGESFDDLDNETKAQCLAFADLVLQQMRENYAGEARRYSTEFYLQILQTTVFLLEAQQPASASENEKMIWAKYYENATCIVSFIAIDNCMGMIGPPIGEITNRYTDYAIMKDGTLEQMSLRQIRALTIADPVVAGVRVINLGSYYNAIYAMDD